MTNNLALWQSVEKTDPAHVKPITGKSYKGSSPAPHWIVRKATETFGPCGIGWGFEIGESDYAHVSDHAIMHFVKVRVWYKWNGERGEVEHIGGTQFAGKRKDGTPFADEDAPKKSVTDALVKALSMIGFAGDIFLGCWDDSKYQAELREEFGAEHSRGMTPMTAGMVTATQKQLDKLSSEILRTGRSLDRLLKHHNVKAANELTSEQVDAALDVMKADKAA